MSERPVCEPAVRDERERPQDPRLVALGRYDILDTPAEERFDRVTRLAQKIFRTPIVTVSVLAGRRLWFKSRIGLEAQEIPSETTFCRLAVERAEPLVVPDASMDPRFAGSDFVAGAPFIRFYAGAPLMTPEGEALGTICVMDQTPRRLSAPEVEILVELARLVVDEMNLRELANVDGLTGALSRRAFREHAERAVAASQGLDHALSLAVFDLDRFKTVNDTHGHAVGDRVLKGSVLAAMRRLKRSEPVGRLGGEEFAVLFPRSDAAEALKAAERLRAAVAAERYRVRGGSEIAVTASFGVATLGEARDYDGLLQAADEALYRAKAAGRDRCVAWDPSKPAPRLRLV